ncbi:MAG: ABC transporter permease [Bacilli bacterium]|jgi:ABC-type uncharacterized transport system permease subunit
MDMLYFIIQQMMLFSIPLLVVALAGLISESSGVTNIALEGQMIVGAFTGVIVIQKLQDKMSGNLLLLIGILAAMLAGVIFTLPLAFASVKMKSNQVISGTALNIIAPALTIYIARNVQATGLQRVAFKNTFRIIRIPLLTDIPFLGRVLFRNAYITTFLGLFILFLMVFVLYKTAFGLRLRATGENPHAVDTVGLNVYKYRYIGALASGALAGLGGITYIVPITTTFDHTVSGYGFLALAVLIFGQWKPWRILGAAFFFGFLKSLASSYTAIPFLVNLRLPPEIFKLIPFIATIVVLIFTSKSSMAPEAVGIPYDKGKR